MRRTSRVFLDISCDQGLSSKRLIIQLDHDTSPKTTENFVSLCSGSCGYGYKGSKLHRIIPGFMCQGGDFTNGDGTGYKSSFESNLFDDENFSRKHNKRGILSMANIGPNTNASQFFITFGKCDWLDGKCVALGEVISGYDPLDLIETMANRRGEPVSDVTIVNCGEITV